MIVDLNQDQKSKLRRLIENKNYSKFEAQVEKLGDFENLPTYLKMGYAGSKTLNPNSKKEDFFPIIEELIYQKKIDKAVRLLGISISNLFAVGEIKEEELSLIHI